MTEDELYELATGSGYPEFSSGGRVPPRDGPLSDAEVRQRVSDFAGEEAARRLPMRLEPSGPVAPGKKFILPVPVGATGTYLAVSFSFGQADADEMLNWKPVWHSVTGPMSRAELEALPRE